MKRKYAVYYVLIAVLAVANAGRWWLAAKTDGADSARSRTFLPEDFRLRMDSPLAQSGPRRDLFQPGSGRAATGAAVMHPVHPRVVAKAAIQAPPPPPSETELAAAELGKLRLLGVVFRGGKGRAYLAMDKENVIALAGDTAFGRFSVNRIGEDAVELTDLKTNTRRRIPVSGK